ncbi:MAG TPA: hypothetical protein VGQ69_06615 [Gemmatimonadales bacterium]|jgi:uncharacterized membrane protein YagU involved in acid resistance|nr:hypothetical protein [Gemmatimonadales bacterium]
MATQERFRIRPDWRGAVSAGLIAGLVFMMLEMIMVPLFMGGSPWGPPRMIAAILLGKQMLPPPDTFDAGILAAALLVHFSLSILYAVILAVLLAGRRRGAAIWIGAAFGLVLYLVNFYVFTALFPWFAMARNWVSVFSHVMFGLVSGWAYVAIRGPELASFSLLPGQQWQGTERRFHVSAWGGPERRRA